MDLVCVKRGGDNGYNWVLSPGHLELGQDKGQAVSGKFCDPGSCRKGAVFSTSARGRGGRSLGRAAGIQSSTVSFLVHPS